jgi:hypothetical protein
MNEKYLTPSNEPAEDPKKKGNNIFKMIGCITLIPIITTAVILIFFVGGCSSDVRNAIIVLEQENQKYVYHSNPFLLEDTIENEKFVDVSFYSKINLYPLDEGIYIAPSDLKPFAAIATNRFNFVDYDQGSHAGFIIEGDSLLYDIEREVIPSDKIGEAKTKESIIISNGTKELRIEYVLNGAEREAIRNCEIKSVWSVTSPYAGKTVGNYVDHLLVNATEVLRFFNPSVEVEFVEEDNILYLHIPSRKE